MVLESVLISFTHNCPVFPGTLLEETIFSPCIFLPLLSKIRCPLVYGFISGLSILFYWSRFLFLCQYQTVLMTVTLQYSLKSGRLIPPVPFFFLKIALAIKGLLCFHKNCEFFCFSSVKNSIGYLIGIVLNLQITFGSIVIFNSIDSSNPGTQTISICLYRL